MKAPLRSLAAVLIISTVFILGCMAGNRAATSPHDSLPVEELDVPQMDTSPTDSSGPSATGPGGPGANPPGSSPSYKQASSPAAPPAAELRQKDEISAAALHFAREVPNVKHVKICFSTVYGGWYLLLYIEKGKTISLQQYSWEPRNREWDFVYQLKELPAKQVEFHLKGEVGDEKCFILKK